MLTKQNYIYVYNATVTNVVDGDTIDAMVDLGFTVHVLVRFRLYKINTSELTDKSPELREQAQKAKQFVIDKVLNKKVVLQSFKTDKYGRWLAYVFIDGYNLNQQLLDENLAVEYT